MKKLLVLALTAMMVLGLSTLALAGSASLDYLIGTWENAGADGDGTALGISLDLPLDSFKVGLNYLGGTLDPGDVDSISYDLRCAYLLSGGDDFNFYLGLGYGRQILDDTNFYAGIILSADLDFVISDTSAFNVMLGVSLSGEAEGDDESSILIANLCYDYYFSDSLGLRIGYRYYDAVVDVGGDPDFIISGLSLGLAYKF